jgi:hypothetical protein
MDEYDTVADGSGPVPTDSRALQELALRLLIPPLDGVTQWQGAKLLVGRASSSVSKDLPLPRDAHVFGSIVCDDRRYESVFVAFSETAEQVYKTFQDRLLAAGWHADDQSASQRPDLRFRRDAYVRSKDGLCVYIYASPSPGRATRVRLDIVRDPSQTPRGRRRIQRLWDLPGKLLLSPSPPSLSPPPGGRHNFQGGGGSECQATCRADLWTTSDLTHVAAHYHEQLVRRRWKQVQAGQDGALAWSTWLVPSIRGEQPWQAVFSVLRLPWARDYYRLAAQIAEIHAGDMPAWPHHAPDASATSVGVDQTAQAKDADSDAATLHALVQDMLTPHLYDIRRDAMVLVGRMPDDLAMSLPLPAGGRLVGSSETIDDGTVRLIVNSPLSLSHTVDFYRDRFSAAGWQEQSTSPGADQEGFIRQDPTMFVLMKRDEGLRVTARAGVSPDASVDVHFTVNVAHGDVGEYTPANDRHVSRALPRLSPPPGGRQEPVTLWHSIGSIRTRSAAHLETYLDATRVMSHYGEQLRRIGWEQRSIETDGLLSWSTWAVSARDHAAPTGRLFVLRSPLVPKKYEVEVQVEGIDSTTV